MEKIQTTRKVERLLSQGNTKEAIELLLNFLEDQEEEDTQFYNKIIQIKAQFLRSQRRRSLGIITAKRSDELVGEVNEEVRYYLALLNGKNPVRQRVWWLKIPNYVYGLILGGVLLLSLLTYQFTREKVIKQARAHCPNFVEEADFNILILPFLPEYRQDKSYPHELALAHFQEYIDSMNLSISAGISGLQIDDEQYPKHTQDVLQLAQNCNAQLVLWAEGEFIHYKFIDQAQYFQFYQLYPGDQDSIVRIPLQVPVLAEGKVNRNVPKSSLNYLLGTAAAQIEDYSSAVQLLRTPLADSAQQALAMLRYLHLADSEMKVNNPAKAIEAYDALLANRPSFSFARLNRAFLSFKSRNYEEALNMLVHISQESKSYYFSEYTKGRTLAKMEQLKEAKIVLEQLDSLLSADSTQFNLSFRKDEVQKTLTDLAKRDFILRSEYWDRVAILKSTPKDTILQNDIIRHLIKLGEDGKAQDLLTQCESLEASTKELVAYRILALKAMKEKELIESWENWMNTAAGKAKFVSLFLK
ncbi:MAG: hypothetical protein AAF849_02970 [Bacteroidota bacterium]